ncbi:MAG: TauD/TfdA family dioxygenase [Caulobacteraceae bacterium]|nr:TauD/TfdA family dioxygenase [Caulobacteraceae bacterium]
MSGPYWPYSISVRPNPGGFGAQVEGVDLSKPLAPEALAAVRGAWAEHAVIWFPDQPLTHDELEAFTMQIGPFGEDPYVEPIEGRPHILEVRREAEEIATPFGAAWHSDWSFQERPPSATLLHAKVVPPRGGDTLFADGCRAYETLSPLLQHMLAPMRAIHSASRVYGPDGVYARDGDARAMRLRIDPAADGRCAHPLVRTHPVTGRKALFVNPVYTVGIEDMSVAEAESLLKFLFKHMTEDVFVYRHRWRPDTLLMWDNRCVMHNATGGYDGFQRLMHRTTVAGQTPV